MSSSSLWEIDKNWSGKEYSEYKNSWLFCPTVWSILMCKYINVLERNGNQYYLVWIGCAADRSQEKERCDMLNNKINNTNIQYDRVLWELSNTSVFNAKDKEFVAECIERFVENNFSNSEYKDSEHIKERFYEIAKDIRGLPQRCKYFVFKGTSCDDFVERWFYRKRLSSWKEFVCEFTLIENNAVIGFSDNLEMCIKGVAK